ncbi:class I SAM-dependent methyltransferase [Mariniradius sediminis]|uniref:Class I SAM-dependent methyltransferase n=1 Tax=Mariniradius sediminis TaxID=2909237 RepID=A0ABS9BRY0_9BACT|nr:class I SAM-dependent methyltransferase [Mariniradius sediminis]MCF1750316.1 class I SAM-dependent methyltransferase [Mariniradius sediminis]
MLNRIRYYLRKMRGDIRANEYIYYPKDFFVDEERVSEVFSKIYSKNIWGSKESVSGKGSETKHTKILLKKLNHLVKQLKIKSMLDSPCGDFNWMQQLDKTGIDYTGMDIVEDLIKFLDAKYRNTPGISFEAGNIIEDDLPKVDLIFCRDCLVHFSFEDIQKALANFKKSGSKYLLTTTYIHRGVNFDIRTGGWRAINLQKAPFNLPKPMKVIWEDNLDDFGMYHDKCMGLWDLTEIEF